MIGNELLDKRPFKKLRANDLYCKSFAMVRPLALVAEEHKANCLFMHAGRKEGLHLSEKKNFIGLQHDIHDVMCN